MVNIFTSIIQCIVIIKIFDQFGSKNNILIPRLLSNVMIARTVLAMFVITQLKPVNTPSAFFVMTKISKTHHLWPTFKKTILD